MCSCRKSPKVTAGGRPILGYQYTFQGETTTFLTRMEALKAQRKNGGGTIKPLT